MLFFLITLRLGSRFCKSYNPEQIIETHRSINQPVSKSDYNMAMGVRDNSAQTYLSTLGSWCEYHHTIGHDTSECRYLANNPSNRSRSYPNIQYKWQAYEEASWPNIVNGIWKSTTI